MKVAGLKIEDSHMQALIVDKRLSSIKTLKVEDIRLPEDIEGKQKVLKDTLIRFKREFGIKGIIVGIDIKHFSYHYVELPVTSASDIRKALTFEMVKYLPLPLEEYLTDFLTVNNSGSITMNLVLSIKKDRLRWITVSVKDVGLRLLSIRCLLIESLNQLLAKKGVREAVFLYKAEQDYYILIIKDSFPKIMKACRSVEETAAEIEKNPESSKKVVYTIGTQDLEQLEKFNIKKLSYSLPDLLVVSALKKRAIDINFKFDEFVDRKLDYYHHAIIAMGSLSVLIFFSTSWLSYFKDYSALHEINEHISELKSSSSGHMEAMIKSKTIDEKLQFLVNFQKNRNRHIEVLRHLSTVLPRDAWLANLHIDETGKMEIQGYAKRSASLVEPLENSSVFKNVVFSSPITVKNQREKFSIRMEVEK